MGVRVKSFAAVVCLALLLNFIPHDARGESPSYAMIVTPSESHIEIVSGNLTASITADWPRVLFKHSTSPFTPTFDVGYMTMYLFNDTNEDEIFELSEMTYVVYLDHPHVTWNVTEVNHSRDPDIGEYVRFGMYTDIQASRTLENDTVEARDWARASFWFQISENPITYQNDLGDYTVGGKLWLRTNMTLTVTNPIEATGAILEQNLQGGGSTNTFMLKEMTARNQVKMTEVSGWVDETSKGPNFTHPFYNVNEPMQEMEFATEDGTVQAFHCWGTVAYCENETSVFNETVRSAYFTTGAGLTLHSVFPLQPGNMSISEDTSIGIDEDGFLHVQDWIVRHIVSITAVAGLMIALVVLAVFVRRRKRRSTATQESPAAHEANK